ncbi:MAG: hypothetical protein K8T91_11470 [Planctomycetes bacterium]|nr:hypothetical protein [Planctomycetota bacterium]
MSATPAKLVSWSSIQGLVVAAAIFLIGTPAGFSFAGLSWKFPWLSEASSPARDTPAAQLVVHKPEPRIATLTVDRVWVGQARVVLCVTVRNEQGRSLHLRSGHVNLSEVGMNHADWPAVTLPPWDGVRFQLAKIQIFADKELPGTARAFALDLTIPPGHQRKFLLQIDAANVPIWQHNRFFAVGSLVLEDGAAELATPDMNLFGRRLNQADPGASLSPVAFQTGSAAAKQK